MALKDLVPFIGPQERDGSKKKDLTPALDEEDLKVLPKLFRSIGLAVGYTGGTYSIGYNRVNFEPAPYDFDRIIQAVDTDSYVKQGFNQYKELFWKEGYTIISQNPEAVEYLKLRIQFMELSMKRSFNNFLIDVADQLVKFGNAFVVKVRADINEFFPLDIHPVYGTKPVIGYELLPAETVEIMRDYHNKPIKYRQNIWGAHGYNAPSGFGRGERGYANLLPTWKPEQVIHFSVDVKPGRLFGTPFFVAVMDDVIALRQVEEDVQNLVHRELFPIYKYIVGTEEHPAEPDEINAAVGSIEGLGTGGGIVLPERHDIDVVGSQGKALDIQPYLDHFKERVAVGMGLTKKRLGMSQANAAKDEEDDTKIFDKIKLYQKTFGELIRLHIFNELLLEADFDPFVARKDVLDTCYFVFNEIDVDTQVKKENHIIQKWISDLVIWDEARIQLKEPLDADRQELYTAISNRELAPPEAPGKPIKPGTGTPAWTQNLNGKGKTNPNAKKPATGGSPPTAAGGVSVNKPAVATRGGSNNGPKLTGPPSISKSANTAPRQKAVANKSMPTNQYGTRTSNIRKKPQKLTASDQSDIMFLEELTELLGDE
jgi:hypothetical protein